VFVRVLFLGLFFVLMFALALAPFIVQVFTPLDLSVWGGFGAFVVKNMVLWVFCCLLLGLLAALIIGFRE
jgi:hypothetical protein